MLNVQIESCYCGIGSWALFAYLSKTKPDDWRLFPALFAPKRPPHNAFVGWANKSCPAYDNPKKFVRPKTAGV
jgi:hypothetical protein